MSDLKKVENVKITFDDGNYKIAVLIVDTGTELKMDIVPDKNMPDEYMSPMIGIFQLFTESLTNA